LKELHLKSHLRRYHHESLVDFATVLRSRCVDWGDCRPGECTFPFFLFFKILDTHRYQSYRLQNSQGICVNQLLSAFGNDFNCGFFRRKLSFLWKRI